jgi:hypothetical protein
MKESVRTSLADLDIGLEKGGLGQVTFKVWAEKVR